MRDLLGAAIGAALLSTAVAGAAAQTATPPGLPAWLAGGWAMQSESGAWSEEWWTPPRAGLMLGAGRSGEGENLGWWEQTRIQQANGKVSFCALPKGQKEACFDAVSVTEAEIVFENPAHDFPTRIAYRRDGDTLFAEISGRDGSQPQRWEFRKVR